MALKTSKSIRVMDLCGLVKELRPQRKLFSAQWKVRLESLRRGDFFAIYTQLIFMLLIKLTNRSNCLNLEICLISSVRSSDSVLIYFTLHVLITFRWGWSVNV